MDNNKSKKKAPKFSIYWMYAIILLFLFGVFYMDSNTMTKEVDYNVFEKYVVDGGVSKIIIFTNKDKAEAVLTDSLAKVVFNESQMQKSNGADAKVITDIGSVDHLQNQIDRWKSEGVFKGDVKYEKSSDFSGLLWSFGPIILFIGFWLYFMRRMSGRDGGGAGGVFSVGNSKAQIFDTDRYRLRSRM